ncbi:MAG TPA: outer membrane protein assembly factor BamE [Rickettsiales bacterium]|nr:outer membrane protein assembly factor BamE [Rickettsiales bacterium]
MFNKYFTILILCFTVSCVARDISQKGYIINKDDLANIQIGLTNRENTIKYLGFPLNKSYFNDNIWIYYSYKIKEVLFFKPQIKEQKVLIIEFDNDTDLIKNLSLYDIKSDKNKLLDIGNDINKDKSGIIKDILNNIGQFSM